MIQSENMNNDPPSYDYATTSSAHYPELNHGGYTYTSQSKSDRAKSPEPRDTKTALMVGPPGSPSASSQQFAMPSPSTYPAPVAGPSTTVYHYHNARTGHTITSLLPPDHPEMICLQQGGHNTKSKFGIVGILAAIFWFPLGVGICIMDRKVTCKRCGMVLHHSILD